MTPFALLAPFIGPMLDRVRQGRRYIMMGTMLARGLLCWAMSGAVTGDPVTLFPAAFGVLVLQKAYSITRSSVTPRLLPAEITLVTANARNGLGAVLASTVAAPIAFGIQTMVGAPWVLRIGTFVYLGATVLGTRIPDQIDDIPPVPATPGRNPSQPGSQSGSKAGRTPVRPGRTPAACRPAGRCRSRRSAPEPAGPGRATG